MRPSRRSLRRKRRLAEAPKLSVVVLSWNTKDLTLACLRALRVDTPGHPREVIVIDNGSEDAR